MAGEIADVARQVEEAERKGRPRLEYPPVNRWPLLLLRLRVLRCRLRRALCRRAQGLGLVGSEQLPQHKETPSQRGKDVAHGTPAPAAGDPWCEQRRQQRADVVAQRDESLRPGALHPARPASLWVPITAELRADG